MLAIGTERQAPDPGNRVERQRRVEMRKEVAAARGLIAQRIERIAEFCRIDRDQQQIVLSGEMFFRGLTRLSAGREMNESVGEIDGRALETAFDFGLMPELRGSDFVEEIHGLI